MKLSRNSRIAISMVIAVIVFISGLFVGGSTAFVGGFILFVTYLLIGLEETPTFIRWIKSKLPAFVLA